MRLWKRYVLNREHMSEALRERRQCPRADELAPGIPKLKEMFGHISLEASANEALLFHGTTEDKLQLITEQGFDERLCTGGLYGRGVYFTTDFCKAAQYCGDGPVRCVILARVLLGHPFLASGPMESHERPPQVDGITALHDSTIARPGIQNDRRRGQRRSVQVHWEFVVDRGDLQAYPELVIRFTQA